MSNTEFYLTNLTQTTDPLIGNRSNISLSSELPSSIFGNQSSGDTDSTVPQISFIIASVISIVGFLGNSATIISFLIQKKVQTPTYTGIFCSSIADLTALLLRYLVIFYTVMAPTMSIDYKYLFGMSALTHMSSNFHVLIIAIIRFIYVSKPFYSLTFQYSKVLYMSLGVWITSILIAALYTFNVYLYEQNLMSLSQSVVVEIFMTSLPFFVSLIPIIILHVLNVVSLRKGLSQSNNHVSKTMSMVLAAIIIIFIVANTPVFILNILVLCGIETEQTDWLAQTFWMLSYCSNPFVFVFYSKTARAVIKTDAFKALMLLWNVFFLNSVMFITVSCL